MSTEGHFLPGEGCHLEAEERFRVLERNYGRFVLVSHLRSGTHMVRTALDAHPGIQCQGEPFNANSRTLPYSHDETTEQILTRRIYPELGAEISAAGFVLHAYHPGSLQSFPHLRANDGWANIWPILARDSELKVIFLRRENMLRRYLSQILAARTGFWHQWKGDRVFDTTHLDTPPAPSYIDHVRPQVEPVQVDVDHMLGDFEEIEGLYLKARQTFARQSSLDLRYEDLLIEPGPELARAQSFLGVTPLEVEPATRRLELRPLAQAIANYDEVRFRLHGTSWEAFLDEPKEARLA